MEATNNEDFFHSNGIFSQVKTTNVTNPRSISSNISTYKKVIDKLAEVKSSGIFTTADGNILQVTNTRLDVVVPKNYNTNVFENVVTYGLQPNKNVLVNFIYK